MTLSIDEYRSRPRAAGAVPEERIAKLSAFVQEAVRATALTGDQNWDTYLRYVEAHIRAAERACEMNKGKAAALVLVDEAAAKSAAVLAATYATRAETLRELIHIPKWIRESGDEAKKKIAELEASL